MKRKNFRLMISIFTLVLLVSSCNKDIEDDKLSFDKDRIEVIVGKTDSVTVKGGTDTYSVKSSSDRIATVKAIKNKIVVTGVTKGTVKVTVKDKSRKTGIIAVSVIEDPDKRIKEDPKTRFEWDKTKKVEGTDKGSYKLLQAIDGKVEWSWKSEDNKSVIILSFTDKAGSITEGIKKDIKLLINGKETKVTKLEVIQTKNPGKNKKPIVWIIFEAEKKKGICVGLMS